MNKLPVYMRIVGTNVSDGDVSSRQAAIEALTSAWRDLSTHKSLLEKAGQIAQAVSGDGGAPLALATEVEAAIQTHAPAYIHTERPYDVGICAALAVQALLQAEEESDGTTGRDLLAGALWSALSYQPVLDESKREALRGDLLEACRVRCENSAEACRERSDVDDIDDDEDDEKYLHNATQAAISGLKRNADLDREELNFLWWSLLNRSRLLSKPLASMAEPIRLVACGIEAAQYLKALPAIVHRDIVNRTLDADAEISHEALLKKIGKDVSVLNRAYGNSTYLAAAPTCFPLLASLRTDSATADGAKLPRTCTEWGSRALLEASIVALCDADLVDL